MNEQQRIAEQIRLAMHGPAWSGPALMELLEDVDAATAARKPQADIHGIWELALHIGAWERIVRRRAEGELLVDIPDQENFPPVPEPTSKNWNELKNWLLTGNSELVEMTSALPDERLHQTIRGKDYSCSTMLNGIAQHTLYHAGQIAILKRIVR